MVVFNRLSVPKQVSWNALIARYVENGKYEEVLNQVYQTKDSWLAIVLHKTSWGRIVTSFPSILYFLPDMLFKTNGRICFLEKIEKYIIILEAMPSLSMNMTIVVLCIATTAATSGSKCHRRRGTPTIRH